MKENEAARSNARLVVNMLLTGKSFKSKEMADAIAHAEERDVNPGTVSSILSRISDGQKCSFGCFIRKTRDGNALIYRLVSEAQVLSENQAYGLTLKKGKDRYPIEQAVLDFPVLQKYLPAPSADSEGPEEQKPFFRIVKSAAKTVGSSPFFQLNSSSRSSSDQDRRIDVTIRYSNHYSLSFSATLATFIMVCCALVLSVAVCCLVAYMFFYPLLVMVVAIAAIGGAGFFFWKNRRV